MEARIHQTVTKNSKVGWFIFKRYKPLINKYMGIKGIYLDPLCNECGESDPALFSGRQKTRCKSCQGTLNEKSRVKRRIEGIEYLGGKCGHCGYDKYRGALEFHHLNPEEKDPRAIRPGLSRKRFFAELDKCILLCANCHREEHHRIRNGRVAESG